MKKELARPRGKSYLWYTFFVVSAVVINALGDRIGRVKEDAND